MTHPYRQPKIRAVCPDCPIDYPIDGDTPLVSVRCLRHAEAYETSNGKAAADQFILLLQRVKYSKNRRTSEDAVADAIRYFLFDPLKPERPHPLREAVLAFLGEK